MSLCGSRITTRTSPPTRRSTVASVVSQSCSACHQRRITSSLVQASKTAWAGASKLRSMLSVVFSVMCRAPVGVAGAALSTRAPRGARRRSPTGGFPPPAAGLHERSRALAVLVVQVPPLVRRRLRIALGRVLPLVLAPERGQVEVAPSAAHRLVAAVVDEVGAKDLLALADEGVGAVPLIHAEVGVEVVGERVPRPIPAHPSLVALDVLLRRARDIGERGVAGVQVGQVGHLVGAEGASRAAVLRPAGHAGLEEEAVHDQLPASLEQVEQARRTVRTLEAVVLLHGHPRHAAPLGREGVAGAGQFLLLHEKLLAGGFPFQGRDDRWHDHQDPSSLRNSSTTSNRRPQRARWRSIQSAASLSTPGSSDSRCVRPSTTRVTTPVSSRTLRCFEIAGFETPKPAVASPTVAGPAARRSTMPRRIGCESALNESLTTGLTISIRARLVSGGASARSPAPHALGSS